MTKHEIDATAEYLRHYNSIYAPGYAVLVTGEWGVGKTFQVKNALGESEIYYVSLFGINTPNDVYSEVYSKMFPVRAKLKSATSHIGDLSIGIGVIGSISADLNVANAVFRQKIKSDKTIVFDDLERCDIPPKVLLGIINLYVEHHKCRVVVICHDHKMTEDFLEFKEKIFGHNIHVSPNIEEAYDFFLNSISVHNDSFLRQNKNEMCSIFRSSDTHSLRILRQCITSCNRLLNALLPVHLENTTAVSEIAHLFYVLSIGVYSGKLKEDDIKNRREKKLRFDLSDKHTDNEVDSIVHAFARYPTINLGSSIISDETLIYALIYGVFREDLIQYDISNSSQYAPPEKIPSWRKLISFQSMDDDSAYSALNELNSDFEEHAFHEPGDILHLFSLLLLMSSEGIIERSVADVVTACQAYVDNLYDTKQLPPFDPSTSRASQIFTGHQGYGFWVSDSYRSEFRALVSYLEESQRRVLRDSFPLAASNTLALVEHDGRALFDQICTTHTGNNPFARLPVLAAIDPTVFVSTLLRGNPANWYWVISALKERYTTSRKSLLEEKEWILSVISKLEIELTNTSGFRRLRLDLILKQGIREVIDIFT